MICETEKETQELGMSVQLRGNKEVDLVDLLITFDRAIAKCREFNYKLKEAGYSIDPRFEEEFNEEGVE